MDYVPFPFFGFRGHHVFAVVEEACADLDHPFLGMIAVWAQVLAAL